MTQQLLLGIDIGGTKCAVALVRPDGTIVQRKATPTETGQRPWQDVLEQLAGFAHAMLTAARTEGMGVVERVGISFGGPLDTEAGVLHDSPTLPGWTNVPVRDFFQQALGLPVIVENDANATALAEWRWGAGRGTRNMVFMTMGTGVGAGLILDGRLYRGTDGYAGEMGHQTILINGPLCACGKRGCLETLASGPAIARLARESARYGREKRVLQLAGGKPADITAAHVVQAAKDGDRFALDILNEAGTYMGVGIANILQILNPERVVIGTIAVHAGDLILQPIRDTVREYAWARCADKCEIVPAELGDRAQDLAAVALLT